jgi:hypothetical protein
MIDQFAPRERTCLLNAYAQCDRIWVFQLDGLHLAHIQTLGQDAPVGIGRAQISDSFAYEQCVRGCVGPRL